MPEAHELITRIRREQMLPVRDVPKEVGPAAVDARTAQRWAADGLRVGGRVVKLEAIRIGQKLWTSREAVDRFLIALQGA